MNPHTPPPVINFPSPVDIFPWPGVDVPWVRARLEAADEAKGWLPDETVKNDKRTYLFESGSSAAFPTRGSAPATWPTRTPSRIGQATSVQKQIMGLTKGATKDLVRWAIVAAKYLLDLEAFSTSGCSTGSKPPFRQASDYNAGSLIVRAAAQ
jgi:hypothetical protein